MSQRWARLVSILLWCAGALLLAIYIRAGMAPNRYAQDAVSALGIWSARFLILTYTLSPLSRCLNQPWLRQCRKHAGLVAVALLVGHAGIYLVIQQIFPDHLMILLRREYLLAGLVATIFLIPMTATSFHRAVRTLGPKLWRKVHWLFYAVLVLTVMHETLYPQDSYIEPITHGVLIAVFTIERLVHIARTYLARSRAEPLSQMIASLSPFA